MEIIQMSQIPCSLSTLGYISTLVPVGHEPDSPFCLPNRSRCDFSIKHVKIGIGISNSEYNKSVSRCKICVQQVGEYQLLMHRKIITIHDPTIVVWSSFFDENIFQLQMYHMFSRFNQLLLQTIEFTFNSFLLQQNIRTFQFISISTSGLIAVGKNLKYMYNIYK